MPEPDCGTCSERAVTQWQRRALDDPANTVSVYACAEHAIHRDSASQIHAASCTAPDPGRAPACDCTPEPLPAPEPVEIGETVTLATGWVLPARHAPRPPGRPPTRQSAPAPSTGRGLPHALEA